MDVWVSDARLIKHKFVYGSCHQSGFIRVRHHLLGPAGEFQVTGNFTLKRYIDAEEFAFV